MDIHLPCNFGDKVYYVSRIDKIKEAMIRGLCIYRDCILYELYNKEENDYLIMESRKVYFIREEAKEAIKGEK